MALFLPLSLFIIFNLAFFHGGLGEVIYEEGYTVTTVLDGNKININPHSLVVPLSGSHDLLLLDSFNSRFYTLSSPLSQESVIKSFAGNGLPGFSDGVADSAKFNRPKSFAMDFKGNVYVADRSNFAIRKISGSGVTTIAGGYSKTAGHTDGPGRNATFSNDYELTFVPDMCALLILDHGHKLIRQINLKQEDCEHSKSDVRGTVWPWVVSVAVSCLLGLIIGFVARPFIMLRDENNLINISKSWMCYLMNLGRRTQMHYFGNRSAVASPALTFMRRAVMLVLSHLSLMLSVKIKRADSSSSSVNKDYVSLLDSRNSSSSDCVSSQKYIDQLKDLICFDGDNGASSSRNDSLKQENVVEKDGDGPDQIYNLMLANITNFAEDASKSIVLEGPFLGVSTVVKRK